MGAVFTGILLLFVILQVRSPRSADDSTQNFSVSERRSLILNGISQNHFTQVLYHLGLPNLRSEWTAGDYIRLGNIHADMRDPVTAVHYWEMGLSISITSDALLLSRMASTYLELQDWLSAQRVLNLLVEVEPTNNWAHYHLGILEAIQGVETASSHLLSASQSTLYVGVATIVSTTLLETSPVRRLMSLGTAFVENDIWDYAELAFNQASIVGGLSPEALAFQGWARYQQGKVGQAWINEAITLAPDNPQVIYLQALEARLLGDYQVSLEYFNQALALDPENPAFLAEIGQTYRLIGDLSTAEEWLAHAVVASDEAPEFQEMLALFYVDEGFTPTPNILELIQSVYATLSDDPDVRASYGWTLYVTGEQEAGLAEIEYALSLSPENPRALYYRGLIALDEGDTVLATELLNQVALGSSQFAVLASEALSE